MRKPDRKRGGFTLIEAVAATVLLVVIAAGFMSMTAVNVNLLAKENRLQRSNYDLNSLAESGEGEPTGRTMKMIFTTEDDRAGDVEEVFEEYNVKEDWEDMGNSMIFYIHGQR